MHDLTIALQYSGQPLSELQSIALGGKYGTTPNSIKPFATLNANQLQEELRRRNVYHLATTKKDLNDILKGTLKGVQRVPTLLLTNPTGNLSDLNIDNYTVLESEPLHDIKGHLNNLFSKLPAVLEGDVKNTCKEIIDSNKRKDKVKCADLRLTAIQLFMFLRNKLPSTSDVVMLLDTVLRISEILYLPAIERSPKRILQMYNCTWIHHMLCNKIFPTTDTLYGSYLHHLVVHAPMQHEIISLSSTDAEAEERLFGQGKQIASQASNRHADNVVFNIVTRLQAKKLEHNYSLISTLREQESIVS